jgi:hypothetical protein
MRLRERQRSLGNRGGVQWRGEREPILQHAIKPEIFGPVSAVAQDQTRTTAIVVGFDAMRPVEVSLLATRSAGGIDSRFDRRGKVGQNRLDIRRGCSRDHKETRADRLVTVSAGVT